MRIIEITALSNGAHRNQTCDLRAVPSGWAVVPDTLTTENFPFGEVTVEDVNGIPTVTEWTPGILPEPEPEPEPEVPTEDSSVWDELDAAYQEGVNTAYDQ